jgi:DNA-binding MarR family transcriptional regulator
MAAAAGRHGEGALMAVEKELVPKDILGDSVILHIALAYFAIGKELQKRTGCSETRGFILSTLRGSAERNQNQIATLLGFDRTVVHRAVKTMIREGLLAERKAPTGRALLVRLTEEGTRYREKLVAARRALEEDMRRKLDPQDVARLAGALKKIADVTTHAAS